MSVVVKDAKIKKAETILVINKTLFILYIIFAILAFFILAIMSIVYKNWFFLLYGFACLLSIIFAWISKQYLDGYGLLVHQAAHMLFAEQVTTTIDEDQKKTEKKEMSYMAPSIEERLKKDFGSKKEDE